MLMFVFSPTQHTSPACLVIKMKKTSDCNYFLPQSSKWKQTESEPSEEILKDFQLWWENQESCFTLSRYILLSTSCWFSVCCSVDGKMSLTNNHMTKNIKYYIFSTILGMQNRLSGIHTLHCATAPQVSPPTKIKEEKESSHFPKTQTVHK